MTDLIKRDDALAAIDTFNRDFEQSWKVQFSADIKALPAINPADRIEELEGSLAWYKMMDAMSSDHVVELTDKLEDAEAKLTKAVAGLRKIADHKHFSWDQGWIQKARIARATLDELEKTE